MPFLSYRYCTPGKLLTAVGNDKKLFAELAELFLKESLAKYQRLKAAVPAGKWEIVQHESHSLKSMAGQLGADELQKMLQSIEIACRQDHHLPNELQLSTLENVLQGVRQDLLHFIGEIA